jgi:hypothetical protein
MVTKNTSCAIYFSQLPRESRHTSHRLFSAALCLPYDPSHTDSMNRRSWLHILTYRVMTLYVIPCDTSVKGQTHH